MRKIPNVKSVMTPFPYSVETDRPLSEALEMMATHDFRHLPVVESGELVGVLSERLVGPFVARPSASEGDLLVRDAPMAEAYVAGLDEPLDNVVVAMAERHLGSAVVVKNGRVAGIFTSTDACRYLAKVLRSEFPVGGNEVA
ncbi:MAG: HPP family protein [Thermoanaerobaculia bacterium]